MKHIIPLALLVIGILTVPAARAQTVIDDSEVICAAIHPCNPDGSVMAEYATGACAARYIKECLSAKANEALASCVDNRDESHKTIRTLKRKVTSLENKLKKLQKSSRR